MSQGIDSNSRREVKIFPILHIPHIASLPFLEHWRRPHIGGHHIMKLVIDEAGCLRVLGGVCIREATFFL
jgi:hypothetical protein